MARLEALRAAVPQLAVGGTPAFTASFGVRFTPGGGTLSDLLRDADHALYQAKADGRNCIVLAGATPRAVTPARRRTFDADDAEHQTRTTTAARDVLDLADRLHPPTGAHRER